MRSFPPLSLASDLLIDMIQFQSQFPSLFGYSILSKNSESDKRSDSKDLPTIRGGPVRVDPTRHLLPVLNHLFIFFYATRPPVSPLLFGYHLLLHFRGVRLLKWKMRNEEYFIIQFIFVIIYELYCNFLIIFMSYIVFF